MILVRATSWATPLTRNGKDAWPARRSTCSPSTNGRRRRTACASARTGASSWRCRSTATHHLHDGDILVWDEAERRAIVARIELNDVMVVDLEALMSARTSDVVVRTVFELGHALGNQHWPAVVKGDRRLRAADRRPQGHGVGDEDACLPVIAYEFLPGRRVIPYLTPHEARRLFGGADAAIACALRTDRRRQRPPSSRRTPVLNGQRRSMARSAAILLQFGDSRCPSAPFRSPMGWSRRPAGLVTDAETLEAFVLTAVRQSAVSDGIALLLAHRAARAADLASAGGDRLRDLRAQAQRGNTADDGAHGPQAGGAGGRRDRRSRSTTRWLDRIRAGRHARHLSGEPGACLGRARPRPRATRSPPSITAWRR